ncbi:hypothetical protein CPB85DRAFT_1443541 [Mucidula mucida]|nr:hypothetical protein CPB85DRAFT_1443541 [Mucidula mucida]
MHPQKRWSSLYLVDQCIVKEHKHQMGNKIHSAFNNLWRRAGFIGDYSYDKEKKIFKGNPAQQYEVKEIVKNIQKRNKEGGKAAKRNHAEAFLVEEVDAILAKSQAVCPDELVEMAIQGKLTCDQTGKCLEHALMQVFFTMGFVLWTRNFELCQLCRRNFAWNCCKQTASFSQFFTVFLKNRKGWQNKSEYKCSLESNTYKIHQCTSLNEHAALDAYQAMTLWIRLYEFWIGCPLLPDELVFPVVSVNGVIHTQEQLSQNTIQALITKFASAAGLMRNFTTHSLYRGGAQFQFMWDKVGRRWSLHKVCWWAAGLRVKVDTLMKYLLDSLSKYEENYSDTLDPGHADCGDVFMHQVLPICDPILHVPASSVHQHEIPPLESTFAVQRPPVPMDAETPAEKARWCAVIAGLPKGQPALVW